ncbi:MAG: efflux RND transporter periplasmic adaptor subunit, partial [Gemmatimonadota bacterium]|nr:efflux RND transporter periplasmic adaptor subunit [Gemmatimonadota bacterium]
MNKLTNGRGVNHMSPRTRRFATAAIVAALLAAASWALVARHDQDGKSLSSGSMAGMPGMSSAGNRPNTSSGDRGMAGMNSATDGSVTLTAAQIRQFGVTFGTAEVRTLTADTRTAGVVTFDETKMAQVAPKFGGFVERLFVNSTGQQVQRGQPMLSIYSPELVAAQQELLLAANLDRSIGKSTVPGLASGQMNLADASRRRLQLWDISEAQIGEI